MRQNTKIWGPLLPLEQEMTVADAESLRNSHREEEQVLEKIFRNQICGEEDFSHMIFSGVKFENCRFWNCSFERTEFSNVIFENCDLSGSSFGDSYLNRVSFFSGKGIGAKFVRSTMKHVLITEGNWNYINLDASRLENIKIEKAKMDSSNITQCRCRQVFWKEVSLINASFFRTSLRGMDFSDSVITGLVLSDDNAELKGAIVDLYQAAELAKRLGVVIKDI